jgi:hypothetical protein
MTAASAANPSESDRNPAPVVTRYVSALFFVRQVLRFLPGSRRAGVELPVGIWFSEPLRKTTIFAEQYATAARSLSGSNR